MRILHRAAVVLAAVAAALLASAGAAHAFLDVEVGDIASGTSVTVQTCDVTVPILGLSLGLGSDEPCQD